jgi:hypothetical protein
VNKEKRIQMQHVVTLNATALASGVYFYRLDAVAINNAISFHQVRKLVVVK